MMMNFFKIISLVLALAIGVTGCTSVQAPDVMASYGKNPQTQKINLPTEEQLLACYTQHAWAGDPQVIIKVATVGDVSGKATYGDDGTGSILPVENASTAIAALDRAKGGKSPVWWVDSTDAMMKVQKDEMLLGLRTSVENAQNAPKADYYLFGNTVGVDSVMVAVNELIAYGVGGGPRQERWSFDMNLRFVGLYGLGHSTSSVYNQYVQQEIKLLVANVFGGGSAKTTVTAQAESVVRGRLQSLMRPMIYAGVAELLSNLQGSPQPCRSLVRQFFDGKLKPRTVRTAANQNSPAVDPRRKQTVAA